MEDQQNDFDQVTPTLTFEPFGANAAPMSAQKNQLATEDRIFDESRLSPEEQKMVSEFAAKIDLSNSALIMQYGVGAQKKIAEFSETALTNVRTKDLGEVGQMLGDMVNELRNFDAEEEEKGFFGFFKKNANKIASMQTKYAAAETNINRICEALEKHQIQLMKDVAMLDKTLRGQQDLFQGIVDVYTGRKEKARADREYRNAGADSEIPDDRLAGGCPGGQRFFRDGQPL